MLHFYYIGLLAVLAQASDLLEFSYPVDEAASTELAQAQWLTAARASYPDSPVQASDLLAYASFVEEGKKWWRASVEMKAFLGVEGTQSALWAGLVGCDQAVWEQLRLRLGRHVWRHRVEASVGQAWTEEPMWQRIRSAYPSWESYTLVCHDQGWRWYRERTLWAQGDWAAFRVPEPAVMPAVEHDYHVSVVFHDSESLKRCLIALKEDPAVLEVSVLGTEAGQYELALRLRGLTPQEMSEWSAVEHLGDHHYRAVWHEDIGQRSSDE